MSGLTLEELLREQEGEQATVASAGGRNKRKRPSVDPAAELAPRGTNSKDKKRLKKVHKNAPAEMKSNRPVARWGVGMIPAIYNF